MKTIEERRIAALHLVVINGPLAAFYGPRAAAARATVLTTLTEEKVPKAKAGWNVFRTALFEAVGIADGTAVAKETEFDQKAREIVEAANRK